MSDAGLIIPVVAILGSFSIPVVAIVMEYKRRRLVSEERRAMIEKGMQPPLLEEAPFGNRVRDPARMRERSLHSGITMSLLGAGFGLGAYLIGFVLTQSFLPARLAGPLTLAACIVGALGIGNLIHYTVTRPPRGH